MEFITIHLSREYKQDYCRGEIKNIAKFNLKKMVSFLKVCSEHPIHQKLISFLTVAYNFIYGINGVWSHQPRGWLPHWIDLITMIHINFFGSSFYCFSDLLPQFPAARILEEISSSKMKRFMWIYPLTCFEFCFRIYAKIRTIINKTKHLTSIAVVGLFCAWKVQEDFTFLLFQL